MSRSSSYTYDPTTGNWTKSTLKTNDNSSPVTSSNHSKNNGSPITSSNPIRNSGDNLTATNSDKDSSVGSVEKQYNDIQINTLTGDLTFIVTEQTIKLKAGDTIKLEGLGKYLSGDYYIKDITRQISNSGYTHSATVIKTDFGESLKSSTKNSAKTEEKSVSSTPKASEAKRTYTVKKGDCLWKIAKQFYGNGADYTKIYDANTGQIANPNLIYPGQTFIIP